MLVYIAGPMRGKPKFNFPEFDNAVVRLREHGHVPVSPAAIDRAMGFDPDIASGTDDIGFSEHSYRNAIIRDMLAIAQCDAVAVLPDWEMSRGSQVEVAFAKSLGLPVLDAMRPGVELYIVGGFREYTDIRTMP